MAKSPAGKKSPMKQAPGQKGPPAAAAPKGPKMKAPPGEGQPPPPGAAGDSSIPAAAASAQPSGAQPSTESNTVAGTTPQEGNAAGTTVLQPGSSVPKSVPSAGSGQAPAGAAAPGPNPPAATVAPEAAQPSPVLALPQKTPLSQSASTPQQLGQGDGGASPPPVMPSNSMIAPSPQPNPQAKQSMRRASPRRMPSVAQKAPTGPLTVDPRSGLPLKQFPPDRMSRFQHIGNDILLHFFVDCDRISSKGKPLRRVMFVTDQTLFVCEDNGSILRCLQVSKLFQLNVATDNSNEVALVVPSEYDIILRFDTRDQRDEVQAVLRAVYKRMTDGDLNVLQVKEIRPNQYRMDKPPGFQLQRIPQRSRAHLQRALETIDTQDKERKIAIQRVQEQLMFEHKQEVINKKQEMSVVHAKLDEANNRLKQQHEELDRLRHVYARCQRRVEEIDSQFGANGEAPANKDFKIRELQEVVEALTTSVTKANEERTRAEALRRAGDFEERDLDNVESDIPRMRGRSLHHQGLIEVLQRQLLEKQKELGELSSKQVDLQKLNLELRKKEETLREIEQTMPELKADPTAAFSSAANAPLDALLRSGGSGAGGGFGDLDDSPRSVGFSGSPSRGATRDNNGELAIPGTLGAPKQPISTDIPEYHVPADEKDFKVDPRTKLRFIDVPQLFADKFKQLQGSIIFFFSVGTKANKRGRDQKRVIVVSDQSIYQCATSGNINRCLWITSVRELRVDPECNIALVVDGRNEYDLLINFENEQTCEEFVRVVKVASDFAKRTPPMQVKRFDHISTSDLRLEKPPTWEFQMHPARPKRGLYRALQQLGKSSADDRAKASAAHDQYTQEIVNRIREELRGEVNLRREREFMQLQQQLRNMRAALQEKQGEVRNLRSSIQNHKCSVNAVKVFQQSQQSFEAQGMYWVPSDPVVMECDLEVLHIMFHGNLVVTSHPNGFINVWDIGSADLMKTLKSGGHTARVTAFFFDGHNLVSGGHDSSIRHWNVNILTPIKTVFSAHHGAVTGVQFDATRVVSSGSDGIINVWDAFSLSHVKALRGHKSTVVAFKMDRNVLASAEWGWIFLWDLDKGIVVKTLRDDNGGIVCLDYSGARLVTGGTGGVITVWNVHTGEGEPLEGHTDDIHALQLQQHCAVSSSADGTVRMWDIKERNELGIFHNAFPSDVRCFHFHANRFVAGENTAIKCWTR